MIIMDNQEIKNLIDTKIKEKDFQWFFELFYNCDIENYIFQIKSNLQPESAEFETLKNELSEIKSQIEHSCVYDENHGDGREWEIVFEFPQIQSYVKLEGTYSSYDSTSWDRIYYSEPYTYSEIRYRKKK